MAYERRILPALRHAAQGAFGGPEKHVGLP
jgi:hypothetical protein